MQLFVKFNRDQRGSVALVFALALTAILVAAGMGIDHGRKLSLESQLQLAIDSAVLAGVKFDVGGRDAKARSLFDANMIGSEAENISVSFQSPSADKYSGQASATIPTTLTGLLGITTLDAAVTATAEATGGAAVCILAVSTTASQQILLNSGAKVDAPACELHAKSTGSNVAVFNAGTTLNTSRTCLAGTSVLDNGGTHPNVEKNCATVVDPFSGTLPVPSSTACSVSNGNYNGGNVTLSPGVYCGWFNFNNAPNVTFAPGLYVIQSGGWNVSGGTWTGNGVTFYFADQSKIQFNSGVAASLTPPTSGTYANIMMYEKKGLGTSPLVFDDSKNMQLSGLIYLPSRDVTFNSGSQLASKSISLVINTLILNQTNWKLTPGQPRIAGGSGSRTARLTN
jgi:Flp pilus assembly protein TadG